MRRLGVLAIAVMLPLAVLGVRARNASASVQITEFGTPSADSGPTDIIIGPGGDMWFVESGALNLGDLTPSSPPVFNYEFPLPGTPGSDDLAALAFAGDGNLWIADPGGSSLIRTTPTGTSTSFPQPRRYPQDIIRAPEGGIYVAYNGVSAAVTRYNLDGTAGNRSWDDFIPVEELPGVAIAPNGKLWFTDSLNDEVAQRINIETVHSYVTSPHSSPSKIIAGPDGNVWFTEPGIGAIGRFTPSGALTEFAVPASPSAASTPADIAPVPCSNALAFTDPGTSSIGVITTSGTITEYPLPTENSDPRGISPGPNGSLWFTEAGASQIGRITGIASAVGGVPLCVPLVWGSFVAPKPKIPVGRAVGWMNQWPGQHGVQDTTEDEPPGGALLLRLGFEQIVEHVLANLPLAKGLDVPLTQLKLWRRVTGETTAGLRFP